MIYIIDSYILLQLLNYYLLIITKHFTSTLQHLTHDSLFNICIKFVAQYFLIMVIFLDSSDSRESFLRDICFSYLALTMILLLNARFECLTF